MLFGDISLPISDTERGEGKGDDEAYEAQQGSPHGETQEQDGGIEAHGLAQHLWHHDGV